MKSIVAWFHIRSCHRSDTGRYSLSVLKSSNLSLQPPFTLFIKKKKKVYWEYSMQKAPPICPSNWSYFFSTRSIPSTRPRAERTSGVPHPPTPTSGCPLPLARRQLGTACSAYSEPADSSPSVAQALTRCVPQSPSSSLHPILLH